MIGWSQNGNTNLGTKRAAIGSSIGSIKLKIKMAKLISYNNSIHEYQSEKEVHFGPGLKTALGASSDASHGKHPLEALIERLQEEIEMVKGKIAECNKDEELLSFKQKITEIIENKEPHSEVKLFNDSKICATTIKESKIMDFLLIEEQSEPVLHNERSLTENCRHQRAKANETIINQMDDDNSADNIIVLYNQLCNEVENSLPRKIGVSKLELWPVFSTLFQTSFKYCRKAFIEKLTEPLYLLTKLSEKEDSTGETDWDRRDELDNVFTAYECLFRFLKSLKLNNLDERRASKRDITEKVLLSVFDDTEIANKELVSKLHDQVETAVELCWRMQMLPTPMFICQPTVYNDQWHEIHRRSWSEDPNQELVYYRPVLMNSAGGTIASRGLVGKRRKDSSHNANKEYLPQYGMDASQDFIVITLPDPQQDEPPVEEIPNNQQPENWLCVIL